MTESALDILARGCSLHYSNKAVAGVIDFTQLFRNPQLYGPLGTYVLERIESWPRRPETLYVDFGDPLIAKFAKELGTRARIRTTFHHNGVSGSPGTVGVVRPIVGDQRHIVQSLVAATMIGTPVGLLTFIDCNVNPLYVANLSREGVTYSGLVRGETFLARMRPPSAGTERQSLGLY